MQRQLQVGGAGTGASNTLPDKRTIGMNRTLGAAALALLAVGATTPGIAAGTPKRGGTLTYMIPADAPP